jgi:hypothetical protein
MVGLVQQYRRRRGADPEGGMMSDKENLPNILVIEGHLAFADEDPRHVRALAGISAQYLKAGQLMPKMLADWLKDALTALASGDDGNKAFELEGQRGRKANTDRDLKIGEKVAALKEDGMPLLEAYEEVGREYCLAGSSIKSVYERWNLIDAEAHARKMKQLFETEDLNWKKK